MLHTSSNRSIYRSFVLRNPLPRIGQCVGADQQQPIHPGKGRGKRGWVVKISLAYLNATRS